MSKTAQKRDFQALWEDFLNLRKLWPYLRKERRLVYFSMVMIPLISALQMSLPLILKHAIDEGIIQNHWETLQWCAVLFFSVVIAEYLTRSAQRYIVALAVYRMVQDLRHRLVQHVLSLKASYHDRNMSGALVTRATGDFDNLGQSLTQGVLSAILDFAILIGAIIGLFILNWKIALSVFILLPIMGKIISAFSSALKKAMLRARVKLATLNAFTQECLYGVTTIKVLTAEKEAQKKYDQLTEEYRNAQMSSVVYDALMFSTIDGMSSIAIGALLWLALSPFVSADFLTAGLLVALVQYIQQLFDPLKQLGSKIAMLQGVFTSIDRIFGVMDVQEKSQGTQTLPQRVEGAVSFKNVSFSYKEPAEENRVLHDVSFKVQSGESLALVGPTGGGKSTVIKLLSKLYEGYEGEIFLDEQDLSLLDGSHLRNEIAIVPQDIVLFDGSIAFNIGLGRKDVSQADIHRAAEQVGAESFISRLPGNYEFQLREQGANLSVGQRQLIVFARALAKNPKMVILDEATSSVDPQSEALIQSAIQKILAGRTVIVIAHRLSTVRQCHQILVIQKGNVIEGGTHEELIRQNGAYLQLLEANQTSSEKTL